MSRRESWLLAAVLVVAAVVGFATLDHQSFDHDEAISLDRDSPHAIAAHGDPRRATISFGSAAGSPSGGESVTRHGSNLKLRSLYVPFATG